MTSLELVDNDTHAETPFAQTNKKDKGLRQKLVDRVSRMENEVIINQMEFEDASRRLEASKQSLLSAKEALRSWGSKATDEEINETKRLSLDPEVSRTRTKNKGKGKASELYGENF